MKLRVLLVDDESLARSRLTTLLGDCVAPGAFVSAEAADANQAMNALKLGTFDVILLDIRMPGIDGITLAQTIAAMPRPPAVVFVTAHSEHAVKAFELEAIDYLTKPVRLERLQQTLQKVERYLQVKRGLEADLADDVLVLQDRGRTERLPVSEVLYFKAELKYITVRTALRSYILEASLNELEERYAASFMRIHRNALIARRAVRALERYFDAEEGDGWALRLNGVDELLPVSRRQLVTVREALANGF